MITLELASPFWEDPAGLSVSGQDEAAVLNICVQALLAAGYDIQVRDEDGDLTPWSEYEGDSDAEAA